MTVLVTGGAGYIGTHSLVELSARDVPYVVLDNFDNSSRASLNAVERITGKPVETVEGDVRDAALLDRLFNDYRSSGRPITGVLHLAALKAVGESVADPLRYYDNNVTGTLVLLDAMRRHDVKQFVFSSSATVYGNPRYLPYDESHPVAPTNPYGQTKAIVEQILMDYAVADPSFSAVILRYFNPIGAHPSGLIGEDPRGVPNNLFPFVTRVAVGTLPELQVFGDDYETIDGSGVRDYIHVMDLAAAHALSLDRCAQQKAGVEVFNLGTGVGTSVLQLVRAFEECSGKKIPVRIAGRRAGDIPEMWAKSEKAENVLGWRAQYGVAEMCKDGWNWQSSNPYGYR